MPQKVENSGLFRSKFVLDKEVGGPFQARVGAARAVRTRTDLRVEVRGFREGSEIDEAEDYKGTSMAGVIWQFILVVGLWSRSNFAG